MMPAPSVSNPLIRLTKMFGSLVCFRSIPGLEKSLVLAAPRFVVSTIMLSALLSGVAVHPVHAQTDAPIFTWKGEVQVSPSTLMIREGEALTYNIRLSEQPAADGWWVRIHVDGVVYIDGRLAEKGIRWVPSVGWAFNRKGSSGPTKWRSVRIEALQDDDDEDEFVTITHDVWDENTNCPPSLHGVAPVEVQVTDDETASTGVRLSVNPTAVSEGAGGTPVRVTAALNGAPRTSPTAVTVAVGKTGDSATEGTDYETVDDLTVTIPPGLTSARETFTLTPIDDVIGESDETITVSGTTRSGLTVTDAELRITDDETASTGVTLSVDPTMVIEGAGRTPVTVRAALNGAARLGSTAVTVAVGTPGDSATEGTDYATVGDLTVTIPAESTSGTATFTLIPVDDDIDEVAETVTVSGTTRSGLTVTDAELGITDDDERGVTVTPTALTLTEGGDPNDVNTYTIVLKSEPTGPVSITLTVTGDSDVTASTETLNFTTSNWDMPRTVTMSAAEDPDTVEDTAMVAHTPSGADYAGVTAASVSVMVPDDDTASTAVTLNLSPGMVSEGVGGSGRPVTVTGRLNGAPRMSPTVVTLSVAGGTAAVGADFTAVDSFTLTIPAESTSGTATFTLIPVDDDIEESDETITVSGTTSSGLTLTPTSLTVTIVDDETTSTRVALSVNPARVSEGAGGTTVTVRAALNGAARPGSTTVTVAVGKTGDSATEGTDYETVDGLTVTIAAESTSGTATFRLTPTDDAIRERVETISVTGTTISGLTVTAAQLRITDNDTAPPPIGPTSSPRSQTVSFGSSRYRVREGETVEVTIRLSLASAGRLTIPLTAKNEDGASDDDYSGVPKNVVFNGGETVATFTFTAVTDDVDERTERVTLGFGALPSRVNVATRSTAEVIIEDVTIEDDRRGVRITPVALEVMEGGRETYTVVLESAPTGPVTVTVEGAAEDVTAAPESLVFTPSNWSTAQTVTVTAAEDEDQLEDAPVTLTHMVRGGGYAGLAAPAVVVTVLENDFPALSINDAEVSEGDGEILFAVTMDDGPSSRTVRVEWVTADGTAKVGEDYTGQIGELVFAPGEIRQEAKVPVLDDGVIEPDETFTVVLSNPWGATLVRDEATGVIKDDDLPVVSISTGSDSAAEGEDVRFDLVRSVNLKGRLRVTVRVSATGTFLSATPPNTVTFGPGESTAILRMGTIDDDRDEADGTVEALLIESDDYAIEDRGRAVVTVTDNDRMPAIGIGGARALESTGEIVFPVTLGAASDRVVTVEWSTSDGTARKEEDYRGGHGVVTFPPGGTAQTIRVLLLDDMRVEEDETFTLTLGRAVNGTSDGGAATGVIEDDERTVSKAWLTRFGRTVASQAVESVSDRLTGAARRASQVTVGGQQLRSASEGEAEGRLGGLQLPFGNQPRMPAGGLGATGALRRASESLGLHGGTLEGTPFAARRLDGRNLLATSSFHLSSGDANGTGNSQGARWAAWGRGVTTQFSGRETDLSLNDGVVTGLVGVDYERGRMLAGLAVSHSNGDGSFFADRGQRSQSRDAELSGSLTSVYPYLRADLGEQLLIWGLFGHGWGEMAASKEAGVARNDIGMKMGAVGVRGSLLKPEQAKGFELAVKLDTFLVGMGLESDAGARITDADASRTRLLLEGSRDGLPAWGGLLGSSVEFGLRRDAGAAETGVGLELGGSLRYINLDRGLTVSVTARRLMAHKDDDYREWGVGGLIEYDPGAARRGLSVRMVSSWGTAPSGTNRLWSQSPSADFSRNGYAGIDAPLSAEVNYRMRAFGGRLQLAPYADVSLGGAGSGAHAYLLGWRLQYDVNLGAHE